MVGISWNANHNTSLSVFRAHVMVVTMLYHKEIGFSDQVYQVAHCRLQKLQATTGLGKRYSLTRLAGLGVKEPWYIKYNTHVTAVAPSAAFSDIRLRRFFWRAPLKVLLSETADNSAALPRSQCGHIQSAIRLAIAVGRRHEEFTLETTSAIVNQFLLAPSLPPLKSLSAACKERTFAKKDLWFTAELEIEFHASERNCHFGLIARPAWPARPRFSATSYLPNGIEF